MNEAGTGWLSARDTVVQISGTCGGDWEAQRILADRLRSGLLDTFAERVVRETRAGTEVLSEVCELPLQLWARSVDWHRDCQSWLWGTGDFQLSTTDFIESEKLKLYGVKFQQTQIDEIAPAGNSPPPTRPASAGRTRDQRWNNWIAELSLFVHEEGIDPTLTADRLITALNDRLATKGFEELGRSTVFAAATAVVDAFK